MTPRDGDDEKPVEGITPPEEVDPDDGTDADDKPVDNPAG